MSMSKVGQLLQQTGVDMSQLTPRMEPLWKGPEEGGITFSLLSRFLSCRERFRIMVVEGLQAADRWNHRLGYGEMWHMCEEALAAGNNPGNKVDQWTPLLRYAQENCRRYPLQQEEIDKWYNVCKVQFPIYVEYWKRNPDVQNRSPICQELAFNVPYKLPSGRVVRLRGKWDSVDKIGVGSDVGVWLQENKTKGDINETLLYRQLKFDLQTMIYLTALHTLQQQMRESDAINGLMSRFMGPIKGVRYNVVRRPLSGGKGTIVRHKATKNKDEETREHYYDRVRSIIDGSGEDAPGPSYFFMRWKVEVTEAEVYKFRHECLDPILEQLCDWWGHLEWVRLKDHSPFGASNYKSPYTLGFHHWRHPFGVYNILDEGGASDLDEYLVSGSEIGLERVETLFPELETVSTNA